MIMKLVDKWFTPDEDQFHFRVSIFKSAMRIAAGVALISGSMLVAGLALIGAEILGIVEEL